MSEQKVGIVTGAARPWGMGYQIAMGLARKGLDIAVIDVREDWGAQAVADLTRETGRRAIFVKTDITRRADVAAMAERVAGELGRIDALVNNAGIVMNEMVEGMTDEGIDSQINVNLKGTALCCQAVIPYMRKAGGGRVVNIASGGAFEPLRKLAIYSATKAAVIAFSKVMAKEVARDNIVVTVVAPGIMHTNQGAETGPIEGQYDRFKLLWGRTLDPAEVAEVVVYAATHPTHVLTGQTLHANGGGFMV
ncbi:MAG TPA: SDR family oxidoreductase [Candidatus Binataceae bacterium]|nr:SDR family oxidoreductase [Candidatus Binataceae bacterium]